MTTSSPAAKIRTEVSIRWMIRRDMDAVQAIEDASFEFPWSPKQFIEALKCRPVIGNVAEYRGQIVGYVIYELFPTGFVILNLAVHPEFRQQSVGRQMIERLVNKLTLQRRTWINAVCCEKSLLTQQFLRGVGFRCVETLKRNYKDLGLDGYRFRYAVGLPPAP